jgi:hypothetical protein
MKRYLFNQIINDLTKKMVFVTGPRQVGKTYLARQIMQEFKNPQYLNYDNADDRKIIRSRSWKLNADIVIFDEIHKMKNWKGFLKGVYDARVEGQSLLITGSARLETYRQSGESLAGRYFHLRLLPLSVRELEGMIVPYDAVEKLNTRGGFPEPFLSSTEEDAARWRNQYYTDLIREDIFEFSRIHEIKTMRLMVELLRSRVGSPLSYSSLAEDLQVSPNTVKKYIQILESLYIVFLIRPYHRHIARSLLKEPKLYFYDSGFVKAEEGIRFENTCAVCLLKYVQYLHDVQGKNAGLYYIKTKDGREIDFVIAVDDVLQQCIEVKISDTKTSPALLLLQKRFPQAEFFQLIHNLRQDEHRSGIEIAQAGPWLAKLPV